MSKGKKSIIVCMMLSISVFGIIGLANITGVAGQANTTLIYGTANGPIDWDPLFAWDSASIDVLANIGEGLFMYDYTQEDSPLIPMLATHWNWSADAKTLDVTIHTGITFQDGTSLNAEAVKWNFDRMNWNFGFTSGLPAPFDTGTPTALAQIWPLYTDTSGNQLIQSVTVLNSTAVRFQLSMPYSAFTALLAFCGSSILSPTSTPAKEEINVTASDYRPVGTGPFKFGEYKVGDYVLLTAYDDYWRGAPKLGGVYFDIINDAQTRNNAMLSKEIHILPDPLPNMVQAGSFNISGEAVHTGPNNLIIQYIGMNNEVIPQPVRKALSYAYDYTYHIAEIMQNLVSRLHGPIPAGMAFYNGSIPYVDGQNLTIARQALIDASLAPPGASSHLNDDTWWTNLAATTPIATYNYTYNAGNQVRQEIGSLLENCSALIGVKIDSLTAADWGAFLDALMDWDSQKYYPLFALGWGPDFNDPDDYIRPLLVPGSPSDNAHVNDSKLNAWVTDSLSATTDQGRQDAYNAIMNYTQNELYPWIFTHQGRLWQVWVDGVSGYTLNIMDQCYFYPVECAQCTLPAAAVPGYDFALIGLAMIASSIVAYLVTRKKIRV
jgi:peptide/nickel transport system substrate-binding protein